MFLGLPKCFVFRFPGAHIPTEVRYASDHSVAAKGSHGAGAKLRCAGRPAVSDGQSKAESC